MMKRAQWAWWILSGLWFAFWHLAITRRTWQDPLYRVPGAIGDNTVMLWNLGWVRHALQNGHPGFWFDKAYHPDGFFFLYGTPTWLDGFLFWLASPLLPSDFTGAILWANINHLVATVASGLLVICGLRAWGVRQWPVLVFVSTAVVFTWFRFFALMGHYHFFGTHWMLGVLCVLSWARNAAIVGRGGVFLRRAAAAGLLLGITFLNDQAMTIFAAVLGGLILLSVRWAGERLLRRKIAGAVGLFYGCSLMTASVHLVPTVQVALAGKLNYWVDKSPRLVDVTSLVLPPGFSYVGGKLQGVRDAYGLTWSEGTYLGVVPMGMLALCTVMSFRYLLTWRSHRRRIVVGATAAAWVFVICALGDRLVVGSHEIITLPGRVLKEIPVVNNIRLPQRWIWPAHLCIGLGGAMLLSGWMTRRRLGRGMSVLLFGVAIIPPLEAIDYPATPPLDYKADDYLRPPVVDVAMQSYTGGAVLMMPAYKAYGHANVFQFMWGYRTPMIMTYTARMPVKPEDLPWSGDGWTPETARWLRENDVKMVIFPFDDGSVERSGQWIEQAKRVDPEILIFDREGRRL